MGGLTGPVGPRRGGVGSAVVRPGVGEDPREVAGRPGGFGEAAGTWDSGRVRGAWGKGQRWGGTPGPGPEERGVRGGACLSPYTASGGAGAGGWHTEVALPRCPPHRAAVGCCAFSWHTWKCPHTPPAVLHTLRGGDPVQGPSSGWCQFSSAAGRSHSYTFAASRLAPGCCASVSYARAALTVVLFFF